jgi:predicted metallo-beta-lactamase superfamily hydrolase
MATFLNDQKLFDQTVTLMEEFYQDHKEWMDKGYGGATWKESLATVFTNRQAILDKIEENIANSKIKERVKLIG